MWYLTGVGLFVVGAVCVMLTGALVLDITLTNKRGGLSRSEGVGGWVGLWAWWVLRSQWSVSCWTRWRRDLICGPEKGLTGAPVLRFLGGRGGVE